MIKKTDKKAMRLKRHVRVRGKISGTPCRPRLNVFRSNANIYAQIIDDVNGATLVSASTVEKEFEGATGNCEAAKKVGLLYSLSEPNSATPIADAKAYLDVKNIEYVEQTANTNDEVVAAASALIAAGVDAVFTPTDNVIMAAEMAIAEDFAINGIPHYTGADSFVRNGAYATCGVNYTDLGAKTADLAYKAITEGMDGMEDYYLMDGGIITVNTDTAAMIGKQAEYSCFDSMGTVVEVTTTKD